MEKGNVTLKQRIVESIDNFFKARLIIVWIILIVLGFGVGGFFIWNEITKNVKQQSTILVEEAQEKYDKWLYTSDSDEKIKLEEELLADLSNVIKKYPDQFATQRALSIRGRMFSEKKEWEKAARDFRDIAKSFPRSYYAPTALFNAAVCYEELNDIETALEMLAELVKSYKNSYDVAYALFMMGRMNEQRGRYSEAKQFYTELKEQYSSSNWSKLAQNRIIYLKVQGQ
jgi:TolA-binding protein